MKYIILVFVFVGSCIINEFLNIGANMFEIMILSYIATIFEMRE